MNGNCLIGVSVNSVLNAAFAAVAGALVFLSQAFSGAYWVTILLGFAFCMVGSKIGIFRKQKMSAS